MIEETGHLVSLSSDGSIYFWDYPQEKVVKVIISDMIENKREEIEDNNILLHRLTSDDVPGNRIGEVADSQHQGPVRQQDNKGAEHCARHTKDDGLQRVGAEENPEGKRSGAGQVDDVRVRTG